MTNILHIASITMLESMRSRIILAVSSVAVLIFLLNFFLCNTFNYELSKVAVDIGLSITALCSLLIIVFLFINQISRDIERRIVYLFLARPLSRYEYILGKFTGFAVLLLIVVLLLGAGAALSVLSVNILKPAYVPVHFNWPTFWIALLFGYLSSLVLLAIAMLCAVFSSTSFLAVLFTLGIYITGQHIERVIQLLQDDATVVSGKTSFDMLLNVVSWVLPNLAAFDLKLHAAHGLAINLSSLLWTGLYGVLYIGLILTLTMALFSKKELP